MLFYKSPALALDDDLQKHFSKANKLRVKTVKAYRCILVLLLLWTKVHNYKEFFACIKFNKKFYFKVFTSYPYFIKQNACEWDSTHTQA